MWQNSGSFHDSRPDWTTNRGLSRTRLMFGLGASAVEERLERHGSAARADADAATYAQEGAVDVDITARASTKEEASQLIVQTEAEDPHLTW